MRLRSGLDRLATAVLLVSLGVVVSGTKACQTDYEFGTQAKVPTGTATSTPTSTDNGNLQPTATPTITPTGGIAGTAVPTATPTETADAEEATAEDDLFNQLSKLGAAAERSAAVGGAAGVSGGVVKPENWLGEAFSKDGDGSWQDSDGDGFSDSLEEQYETDSNSAGSAPRTALVTRLAARVGRDALTDEASTDPDAVADADLDGVRDDIEEKRGMNPRSPDSDNDGLSDSRELAYGANPLQVDSDGDGVADGREVEFGADPTVPESR
jgi:hypothetical protein